MKLIEIREPVTVLSLRAPGLSTSGQEHEHGSCAYNFTGLTSLEGSPKIVDGDFHCNTNHLKTLAHGPVKVGGEYCCYNNNLKTLEGAPRTVGSNFYCNNNDLISIDGAPTSIGGFWFCYQNRLTSLKDIHKIVKHVGEEAYFATNPITSHVLGVMLIDGLKKITLDNKGVQKIVNRHLAGDRDVFACQEELIEAGFDEFAKL